MMSKDCTRQHDDSINDNAKDLYLDFDKLKKCTDEISQCCHIDTKKLSYWKTESSEPMINCTIGRLLEQAADRYSNRIAVSFFGGEKLTYAETLEKVDIIAASLLNLDLKKGDHIAIWGFNSVEWYLSFLAAVRIGLVVVNLSPLYEGPELSSCLIKGDIKALVMDEKLNDRNFYCILKTVIPEIEDHNFNEHITSQFLPLFKTVIIISDKSYKGTFNWNDLSTGIADSWEVKIKAIQSEIDEHDVCNIQFTSGTTSQPKGVLLTHYSLTNPPHLIGKYLGLYKKHHRVCLQVPLFHVYGTASGIIGSILTGSTLVFPSAKFSPNKSIDCIIAEKCTIVHGTATMYTDLLTVSQKRALVDPDVFNKMSSIEIFHTGGAICLPGMIMQLQKLFKNAKFTSGYGMTETSTTTIMSMPEDSLEVVLSTLGRVVDHVEVKVVDQNNEMVLLGTPGEMCFRGPMIMKGYYKEPEKTKAILTPDGWLYSGDKFILLENGYTQIVGRIKDIIIRGGENIDPKEVEELIIQHPDVADVQVFGISDSRLGEVVAAAVVKEENSNLNEQHIQTYCHGMIACFKIPQYIIFVKEFPKTASGKIQKFKLKEMTERLLQEQLT